MDNDQQTYLIKLATILHSEINKVYGEEISKKFINALNTIVDENFTDYMMYDKMASFDDKSNTFRIIDIDDRFYAYQYNNHNEFVNKKINAIKLFREVTGNGLIASKNFIEQTILNGCSEPIEFRTDYSKSKIIVEFANINMTVI